jgi:hypothetical protein
MKNIQLLIPRISNSIHKKITRKKLNLNLIPTIILVFEVYLFLRFKIVFLKFNFFSSNFFYCVFILF